MAEPVNYTKRTFQGGMNQQVDATKIAENQYPLLINGRSRFDRIRPNHKASILTLTNYGWVNVQGIFASDQYIVVFADGKGYYRNLLSSNDKFVQIANMQLDPHVATIYACLVPAATNTFIRKQAVPEDITQVNLTVSGQAYPAGLVVQDGINQPWIIDQNAVARELFNYGQWTTSVREYVPIGKQMMFLNGVLYVANGTRLYRSCTGRPLDFMIVVDENGDKLASPLEGNADAVSYQVDFAPILAIHPLPLGDGSFYLSTGMTSYLVTPDRVNTIFGEPTFANTWLFPTGTINQFSFVDVVGDDVFMTKKGIRSFNAVQQTKFAGNNLPFSKQIYQLFGDITQTTTAAIVFQEEYALFACETIYGPSVIAYNILNKVYEAVDIFKGVTGTIKQFAVATISEVQHLFAITTDNELLELYADTHSEKCGLYLGEWLVPAKLAAEQKANDITIVFDNIREGGTFYATLYVDRAPYQTIPTFVPQTFNAEPNPITPPFGVNPNKIESVRHVTFNIQDAKQSWKCGIYLEWEFDAEVLAAELNSTTFANLNSLETQADELAFYTTGKAEITYFTPEVGPPATVVNIFGKGMLGVLRVTIGDISIPKMAKISDSQITLVLPDGLITDKIQLHMASGNIIYSAKDFTCIQ